MVGWETFLSNAKSAVDASEAKRDAILSAVGLKVRPDTAHGMRRCDQ